MSGRGGGRGGGGRGGGGGRSMSPGRGGGGGFRGRSISPGRSSFGGRRFSGGGWRRPSNVHVNVNRGRGWWPNKYIRSSSYYNLNPGYYYYGGSGYPWLYPGWDYSYWPNYVPVYPPVVNTLGSCSFADGSCIDAVTQATCYYSGGVHNPGGRCWGGVPLYTSI